MIMTSHELNRLSRLKQKRDRLHDKLRELRADAASPATSRLTGMPKGPHNQGSQLEWCALRITEVEEGLRALDREILQEEAALQRYISSVPCSKVRRLLGLYFVDGLTWPAVAIQMGGTSTPSQCKNYLHRYLRSDHRETLERPHMASY